MSLKQTAKDVVELVGLVPTIAGYFKLTPRWFRPSPFYEPDSQYAAAGVSFLVFVGTVVYLSRVRGPVTSWSKAERAAHFREAVLGCVAAVLSAAAYIAVVRLFPYAGIAMDLVQVGLWAAFFGFLAFAMTTAGCLWKSA